MIFLYVFYEYVHHDLFFGRIFLAERVVSFTLGFYEGQICLSIDIIPVVLNGDILLFSSIFRISRLK
jgi:hypothetical protein